MIYNIKPLVIYHFPCIDGFAAAFAAWTIFKDAAEYLPMNYGDCKEDDKSTWPQSLVGREVYLLDFSLPKVVMDHILNVSSRFTWLDHHSTSFEMWCGHKPADKYETFTERGHRHFFYLNNGRSGALMAWRYFHSSENVPLAFKYIDDYDRWELALPQTKEFAASINSLLPWTFEQWSKLFLDESEFPLQDDHGNYANILQEGTAILRSQNTMVKSCIDLTSRKCIINGVEGIAVNCPYNLSNDVGSILAEKTGSYGLCWFMTKSGVVKVSLRGIGKYDLTDLAATFGGGGHKNASGFITDMPTLQKMFVN